MIQPDLFDAGRYPNSPGHRNVSTSIAAAEAVKDGTGSLRSAPISHGNGGFDQ